VDRERVSEGGDRVRPLNSGGFLIFGLARLQVEDAASQRHLIPGAEHATALTPAVDERAVSGPEVDELDAAVSPIDARVAAGHRPVADDDVARRCTTERDAGLRERELLSGTALDGEDEFLWFGSARGHLSPPTRRC